MAKLDLETIESLTNLSRIKCTEEEKASLLKDLGSILSYVELLQNTPTENTPPCNTVLEGMVNVMREDVVKETLPRDVFLSNAPEQIGGLIRVPPVIKQG